MQLWKKIVDDNLGSALILEDDAEFCPNFNQKLDEFMQRVPKDYDIIQLGCVFGCNTLDDSSPLVNVTEVAMNINPEVEKGYNQLHYMSGAHAYIITNKAARELYDNIILQTHIDIAVSYYMQTHPEFNVYSPTKDLVTQKNLNFCSNLTDKFPNLLLSVLDNIHFHNHKSVSLGWILTESAYRVPFFDINFFLVIFIVLSVISRKNELLMKFMLAWLLLEIFYSRGQGVQYLVLFLLITMIQN